MTSVQTCTPAFPATFLLLPPPHRQSLSAPPSSRLPALTPHHFPLLSALQVRRAADPAKNLVREFLTRWKGNPLVSGEESYAQLTSAIQQLGAFYQANGQRARLTPAVGQAVLDTLDAAEAALPTREGRPSPLPFF